MNLPFEIILAALRHALTGFGLVLANTGLADRSETETAMGAVATLVGFAWSIYRKWDRHQPPMVPPRAAINLPLFLAVLAVLPALLLTGCMSGSTAVPSSRIKWNMATGEADLTLPKDEAIQKVEVIRQGTNVTVRIEGLNAKNNPDTVALSYAGQAAIQQAAWGAALQMFQMGLQTGLSAAGIPVKVPIPNSTTGAYAVSNAVATPTK